MVMTGTILLFDSRTLGDIDNELSVDSKLEKSSSRQLCCAVCRFPITHYTQATKIEQKHIHLKRNPSGNLFRFGCYRNASGCGHFGEFTHEYTWFNGYKWCNALCLSCNTQLGWCFTGEQTFYGLIVEQLVDCKIDK